MSVICKTKSAHLIQIGMGIIKVSINEGVTIDQEAAIENYLAVDKLLDGRKHACIIDKRANSVMETPEAFEFNTSEKVRKTRVASAYIVKSPLKKLVRNIKLKLNKTETCVKFFTEEYKAVEWVKFKIIEEDLKNNDVLRTKN
jgi:hypothetical protein